MLIILQKQCQNENNKDLLAKTMPVYIPVSKIKFRQKWVLATKDFCNYKLPHISQNNQYQV